MICELGLPVLGKFIIWIYEIEILIILFMMLRSFGQIIFRFGSRIKVEMCNAWFLNEDLELLEQELRKVDYRLEM